MSDLDFGVGFKSAAERVIGERERRLANAKGILSFGVRYLDDCLGGIFPNDLIVVGAKTGIGKTALSTIVAHTTVKAGKKAHYLALEAEEDEIERRIKFNAIAKLVYRNSATASYRKRMNYLDWYAGKLDAFTGGEVDAEIERRVAVDYKNLFTYYKRGDFDADTLVKLILAVQDTTDILILDHLMYVDTSPDVPENRGLKDLVKRIRDVALNLSKPVIVVAHLRKSDRRSATIIPDIDEFYGSSDVTKIATKCIVLAPANDQPPAEPTLWPTYIQAVKCRAEGTRARYGAVVSFDITTSSYRPEYTIGRFNPSGSEFKECDRADIPVWAEGGMLA